MEPRELWARLPSRPPFNDGRFFHSFVGNFVLPLIETNRLGRYWFTQYGEGNGRFQIRFRFEVDSFTAIETQYDTLLQSLGLEVIESHPFDIVGDLCSHRFLGTNQRRTDFRQRGEIIFDFLHKSAKLYVDCLSHEDPNGYWYRENNLDLGNNDTGDTIETFHHLFCNMTGVPCEVVEVEVTPPNEPTRIEFLSRLYFKIYEENLVPKGYKIKEIRSLGYVPF